MQSWISFVSSQVCYSALAFQERLSALLPTKQVEQKPDEHSQTSRCYLSMLVGEALSGQHADASVQPSQNPLPGGRPKHQTIEPSPYFCTSLSVAEASSLSNCTMKGLSLSTCCSMRGTSGLVGQGAKVQEGGEVCSQRAGNPRA